MGALVRDNGHHRRLECGYLRRSGGTRHGAIRVGTVTILRGCSSVVERQLPKLNVEGSIPFTRFYLDEIVTRFSTEETSPFSWAHGGAFGTTIIHIIET